MSDLKIKSIRAILDHILVTEMEFKERFTEGGIFVPNDDKTSQGIRPRWAKVYAVGPDQHDVTVGQWVCVAHGRWTRGSVVECEDGSKITVRRVDKDEIFLISDEKPNDMTMGNA